MYNIKQTVNIIGSGVGGLATAIRLAAKGHEVNIFEKNAYPGGKLTEFTTNGYRFDKGPSLFTLPELIDELSELTGFKGDFRYRRLETISNYFYEDGSRVTAYADQD
ncbi:MAG: phytoene desaturase family protein, partial [Sphingobacteriaceae bacterium]